MIDHTLAEVVRESQGLGFLGPGDPLFHVEHAAAFAGLLGTATRILDLGTGGGIPGLVLALDHPELSVTLLDANARRCAFVDGAAQRLGIGTRVEVVEGRAEELGRHAELRATFDAVVSRSFGAPSVTAECGAPFLRVGGILLVSEPPDAAASDRRWPAAGLAPIGLVDEGRQEVGGFGVRRLSQSSPCPDTYPRRVGLPAKRPLF